MLSHNHYNAKLSLCTCWGHPSSAKYCMYSRNCFILFITILFLSFNCQLETDQTIWIFMGGLTGTKHACSITTNTLC